MKLPKELIPIALALAALIAFNILYRRSDQSPSSKIDYTEGTSYGTGERGAKALYLLLERLGYKISRLRASYRIGLESDGLMILLAPGQRVKQEEVEQLLEWVRQGNTLLFAPGNLPFSFRAGRDPLAKSLRISVSREPSDIKSLKPADVTELSEGVNELILNSGNRIHTKRQDAVKHFRDKDGIVGASLPEGEGTVVVLSDPYFMTNAGINEGDNLNLIMNVLLSHAEDRGTVYFDEYHHGFEEQRTIWHLLRGTSLGWALLQVALAVILLMYGRGRRFGRPKPAISESHRSATEYVNSLAGIYQSAGASDVVLSILCDGLARSLRNRLPEGHIEELMEECQRKIKDRKPGERDLLDLSRRITLAKSAGKGG